MAKQINTEQCARDLITFIKHDADRKIKGTKERFHFDFKIIKEELPFDFEENKFIQFFKDELNIYQYNFDDFGYMIRFSGSFIYEFYNKTHETFFTPSEELISQLKSLPNSNNF